MIATVKYKIANYKGTVNVECTDNEDDNVIIAKVRKQLIDKAGPLPMGYRKFEIISKIF